jgi:chromosome segregation ATPase
MTDVTEPTGLRPNDDASLRRWGGDLGKIASAIQEVHAEQTKADAGFSQATAALSKIAQQADSDQPASKRLAAEVAALAEQARNIDNETAALAERRRALIAQAETLPGTFKSEHERDLDRADFPRNGWQAEKRADLAAMETDS